MNCRHCQNQLTLVFCDLQTCPPSNAMVKPEMMNHPETYFPLKVFVCEKCWLVQVDEIEYSDILGGIKIFAEPFGKDLYCIKNTIIEIDTSTGLTINTVSQ